MEAFFKTHKYLVEHLHAPVRRGLMDEIDWNDRLIGIKGSRGVGKTTFLLDYARDNAKYEIKVADSGESAYQMANEKVKELFANLKDNPTFFCGKEGGYGNVLKLINQIITPNDILG